MNLVRNINGRLLRCGYTTGSCAAAAAKAAAVMLLSGRECKQISIDTPRGIPLTLDVCCLSTAPDSAACAVRKNGGDDPDATDGLMICARVEKAPVEIEIGGGEGVGTVTRPGLDQPVGAAAINSVPRRMIAAELRAAAAEHGYTGGFRVTISIPGGAEVAARTFNPRMGIAHGLSVIGTSGIVDPMSNQALADTVRLELRQLATRGGQRVLLTPGNYGKTFAQEQLHLSLRDHVICSNFIGDAIDAAVECGLWNILLVGHIGKLVKLGIGMTNTHSSFGDGRMETLLACALRAGAGLETLRAVADCVTADAALAVLRAASCLTETLSVLGGRMEDCLVRRVPTEVKIGWVCFTNAPSPGEVLVQSGNAETLMEIWRSKT